MSEHSTHTQNEHPGGTYGGYLIGFVLSVVLTAIPFWLVLGDITHNLWVAIPVIFFSGALQILVHIHYFLHVTIKAEQGWQFLSMIFTFILLVIMLAGSIWIMYHLDKNMMPSHEQIEEMKNLP